MKQMLNIALPKGRLGDKVYDMLDSLSNVTKEKCKEPTIIDIKVDDWLGLDVNIDGKLLSEIIREVVVNSVICSAAVGKYLIE